MNPQDVHYEADGELFVWNRAKAEWNWRKHGIKFEEAASVFGDPYFVLVDATRKDEARNAAIGFDTHARLLYVVHVEIETTCIRIISARRAESREESRYVE